MEAQQTAATIVNELMEAAFGPTTFRDPRSDEYKAGVRAALEFRFDLKKIAVPYPIGSAQADAFFAGTDEGHRLWREYVVRNREASMPHVE